MRHRTTLLSAALTAVVTVLVSACADATGPGTRGLSPGAPSFDVAPKVTICHAAGLAGTTKYVEITISANAGDNPHIDGAGTTRAGHEQDFYVTSRTPCPSAQLQVCVVTSSPAGFDNAPVPYNVTVTATGAVGNVITQNFLYATSTQCSANVNVVPGTYSAQHPAPGLPDVPPPDNGTWFVTDVVVSPLGAGISAIPALGTSWNATQGRGLASSAMVNAAAGVSTVVTFSNTL